MANILYDPLLALTDTLGRALVPGGKLCLTGLRSEQIPAIQSAYWERFQNFQSRQLSGGWCLITAIQKRTKSSIAEKRCDGSIIRSFLECLVITSVLNYVRTWRGVIFGVFKKSMTGQALRVFDLYCICVFVRPCLSAWDVMFPAELGSKVCQWDCSCS